MEGVPYARLRGFPKLFSDYSSGAPQLNSFFAGDWRQTEPYEALVTRASIPVDDALVRTLERQNERWGNPVEGHISALSTSGALAVVTGQQVGLFGGPLYTLYKALTALQLARELRRTLHRPVVPVFWLEGNDHDLAEVSSVYLPNGEERHRSQYHGHEALAEGNWGSVGPLVLQPDIDRMREELRSILPETEFTGPVLDNIFGAYRTGVTFTDAFARTLVALVGAGELVLMDPEDHEVKRVGAPIMERALHEHAALHQCLVASTEEVAQNYHAQVQPRPTTVFYHDVSGRHAVRLSEDGQTCRAGRQEMSVSEMASLLRAEPHRFSPNVLLRPLFQDCILPTVAYVAGPGEVSYFAQLKKVYEWARIPMPIIYPRASITIIEPGVHRIFRKYALSIPDLQDGEDRLLERMVMSEGSLTDAFLRAETALSQVVKDLVPVAEEVDLTLARTTHATGAAWLKELGKLKRRVTRAEKRKHDVLRSQLARTCQAVFPGRSMQERVLPALYFLSKYGPSFLDLLKDRLSLDTATHQTIVL